jgi:hypothetical protein
VYGDVTYTLVNMQFIGLTTEENEDEVNEQLETLNPLTTNPQEVLAAINILFPADHTGLSPLVELRIPKAKSGKGVIVGYFNDPAKIAAAICKYSGDVPAVYYTLNTPAPELAGAALNTDASGRTSTSDNQITVRNWMLVDCDPIRVDEGGCPLEDQKCSSTNTEKAAAFEILRSVWTYLKEKGWSAPISADSGNGYHLLYNLGGMPNSDEVNNAIEDVLSHLARQFNTDAVKIDTTVSNASRITKAYGSIARKGIATADRPHRKSSLREVSLASGGKVPVTLAQLKALIPVQIQPTKATAKSGKSGKGIVISAYNPTMVVEGNTVENVEKFLDFYGIDFSPKVKDKNGAWKWSLLPCPFNEQHNAGE